MKLFNQHKLSTYYHPVTKMCYRKIGEFYYFYDKREKLIKSFMRKGFNEIPQDSKVFDLNCDCNDIGLHTVKICVDNSDSSVLIYTGMSHFIPWYKRLRNAYKYVLGTDNTYVDYQETYMHTEDFTKKMKEIINFCEE